MSGTIDSSEDGYGVCARAALYLFKRTKTMQDNFAFRLSVLEIYNEMLIDLLVESPSQGPGPQISSVTKLNVIETERGVVVPGLHIMPIDSADEAINLFIEAQSNRVVAEHQLNRRSSRSHVIYTYYITRTHISKAIANINTATSASGAADDPVVHQSKLHIVDLAGSERTNKTGSIGNVQKEANYINKSLSYLEQVVIALGQTNRDHIPFRQSKLTYMLKDCLGGNCNTYLIACIWPRRDHSWETLSTLRFAARMKMIETHPIRNRLVAKEQAPSRVIQQQLEALKKELAIRDFLGGKETVWLPELSKAQKFLTCKQCIEFAASPPSNSTNYSKSSAAAADQSLSTTADSMLHINSLSQANLLLDIMKRALWEACNNNGEMVITSLQNAFVAESLVSASKISKLFGSELNSIITAAEILDKSNVEGDDGTLSAADNSMDAVECHLQSNAPSTGNERAVTEEALLKSREEYLQIFTAGPGKELGDSFEEAKEALKSNKARQREIVNLLNEQKALIDEYSNYLSGLSEGEIELPENGIAQERLDAAKKSYRAAHHELQICKEQINEMQSLKKRAMSAMLTAFNEYVNTLSVSPNKN